AQPCVWTTRVAAGFVTPTGDAVASDAPGAPGAPGSVDARQGPVIAFDVARFVSCRVELQAGVEPQFLPLAVGTASDRAQLSGLHVALAYHPWQFRRGDVYFGPLIGAVSRDRVVVNTGAGQSVITLPGGWGVGLHGGYRIDVRRRIAFDANVRWQTLRMPIAGGGRLDLNPFVITAGPVFRH